MARTESERPKAPVSLAELARARRQNEGSIRAWRLSLDSLKESTERLSKYLDSIDPNLKGRKKSDG